MLGSINTRKHWQWFSCGKHPVAGDYFAVGSKDPMLLAFSDWMEKGYQSYSSKGNVKKSVAADPCSWRFWARGVKKDTLVCGLVKESSDRVGRPYPLMVTGTGGLDGWSKNWTLTSFSCEQTWSQMEYFASKRFSDFEQFEEEMAYMRAPAKDWRLFFQEKDDTARRNPPLLLTGPGVQWNAQDCFVSLGDSGGAPDLKNKVAAWYDGITAKRPDIPNAVFLGGTSRKTTWAIFWRPLAPEDFGRMWGMG